MTQEAEEQLAADKAAETAAKNATKLADTGLANAKAAESEARLELKEADAGEKNDLRAPAGLVRDTP